MTKSLEAMTETIHHPNHPFRKVDNQPTKPLKHRYERRKIKGCLHLGDWNPPVSDLEIPLDLGIV
jgi:hypothetical protein